MIAIVFIILSLQLLHAQECTLTETELTGTVKCDQPDQCAYCSIIVEDAELVNCGNDNSCLDLVADISAVEDFLFECTGYYGCAGAYIYIDCEGLTIKGVKCGGEYGCAGATIIIDGGTDGCVLEKIEFANVASGEGATIELINVTPLPGNDDDDTIVCEETFDYSCSGLTCTSTPEDLCPVDSLAAVTTPVTTGTVTTGTVTTGTVTTGTVTTGTGPTATGTTATVTTATGPTAVTTATVTTATATTSAVTTSAVTTTLVVDSSDSIDSDTDDADSDSDSASLVSERDSGFMSLTAAEAASSTWAIVGYVGLAIIICIVIAFFVFPRYKRRAPDGLTAVTTVEEGGFVANEGALPADNGTTVLQESDVN